MSHERTSGRIPARPVRVPPPARPPPAAGAYPSMGDHRGVAADKRGSKTVRDLLLSLVVLGFMVFVIYLFIPHDSHADPVKVVPYGVELGQARRVAPYPVAGPEGLDGKWRSTSVTFSGADPHATTWHVGFVDPEEQYVAVEQSNGPADAFVSSVTLSSHRQAGATVKTGGMTWERWTGGRYTALVNRRPGVTTVVLGTAPDAQLEQMAAALKLSGGTG